MYTYTAGSTGLDAAMPPWVQEGGYKAWAQAPAGSESSRAAAAGDDDADRRLGEPDARGRRRRDAARRLQERGAAQLRRQDARRGRAPARQRRCQDTAMDLVIEDGSRVQVVYFLMSEDNVQAADRAAVGQLRLGRGVDGARGRVPQDQHAPARRTATSRACSASTCATSTSSRSRKRSASSRSLPATTLRDQGSRPARAGLLRRRRRLRSEDDRRHATYEKPHQYSTGDAARVGQRRAGAEGRRAHRREARAASFSGPGWKPRTSVLKVSVRHSAGPATPAPGLTPGALSTQHQANLRPDGWCRPRARVRKIDP